MSKISTYDNASPVTLSDRLIGTSVGATPANATKNFLVSDLLALFEGNITLEDVLVAGNTSTTAMILGGSLRINSGLLDATGGLGTSGQALLSTGTTVSWGEPTTSKVSLPVRYLENVTLGDPLYIAGYNSGQNIQEVRKADSSDPNKMPAIGLADASYSQNTNGTAIMIGGIDTIDLSGIVPAPTVGSVLYVSNGGGGLVSVPPVGTSLIQNVGIVSKTGVSGEVEVTAIGRANALPNFTPEGVSYGLSTGAPAFSSLLRYNEDNNTQGATTFTGRTTLATQLLKLPGLPTHADNAAALAGDLVADDVYKTATGELRIVV
jgi:hypothetical protein